MPIRPLPERLVNRIAAGEVVERPAAAVKELVENAIDAGATRIRVALDGGGIDRIEVTDDGHGMPPDDLALAVLRHCTSKLADDQLIRITTLGFRGEALPSIGAAARLTLVSRPPGAPHAHAITVEGGQVGPVTPAAGPPGTTATVRDLFFATPARRKFLKQPRTEAEHAEAALRRLAFAAPHVAFRLEIDGRCVLDLPSHDPADRAAALLGTAPLHAIDAQRGPLALAGFAAPAALTRPTPAGQSVVVNGRPVTDKLLTTALRVAYRDVIPPGRHPIAALVLTVPADEVDVNVHPAKTELRFRDPESVRALVIGALRRTLATGVTAPSPALSLPFSPRRPHLQLVASRAAAARPPGFAEPTLPLGPAPAAARYAGPHHAQAYATDYTPDPVPDAPLGTPIAQLFDTYILALAPDGSLILVDQHAAHERLTHETLRAQHEQGGIHAQKLLLPAVIDLPEPARTRLLDAAPLLDRLGLALESFGPGAVLVRALPAALGAPDPAPLLRDLADELADSGEPTALLARLDAVLARLACHGSIRAGRRLQRAEMDALLRQMEATPRAATCSHGRPTVLTLDRTALERLFQRR